MIKMKLTHWLMVLAGATLSLSAYGSAANSYDQQAECKALDAQIQQYDSMARQPQSGQAQDRISAKRKKARDRQFQLKC
jgi:hypothetical protein